MNEDVVDACEESLEVEYKKRIIRTYICPIRPRYRDNKYMYLSTLGRALASFSLSNLLDGECFGPTSRCKYTRNEYSKSVPRAEKLDTPLFHRSKFRN